MDQNALIGNKVKKLRQQKKYTLKMLSEKTGLSAGFLSQFERGMSTIAIDALSKIADTLDAPLSGFFDSDSQNTQDVVIRSYNQEYTQTSPYTIQHTLSRNVQQYEMLPRIIQLLPSDQNTETQMEIYTHSGEEFIYVLEGVLSMYVSGALHTLNPGDSIQLRSSGQHNWANRTNKVTKILVLNYPNPLKENASSE